jgi:uncharacterized Zn finger protein
VPCKTLKRANCPKENDMKCPNCGKRTTVELDTHSAGFTSEEFPVKECSDCGLVWCVKSVKGKKVVDIIKPGKV